MITARCFTNLDGYEHESWPTQFPIVPQVGNYVESRNGKSLKIVSITVSLSGTAATITIELNR